MTQIVTLRYAMLRYVALHYITFWEEVQGTTRSYKISMLIIRLEIGF